MAKIGILTGGGDCPGLNPAIRAVVRKSYSEGLQVIGIKNGWKGLIENDTMELNLAFDIQELEPSDTNKYQLD